MFTLQHVAIFCTRCFHSFLKTEDTKSQSSYPCKTVLITPQFGNSAAMNIGLHVSFWIIVLPRYMPRHGIARSYGNSIYSFWNNLHTVFHSGFTTMQTLKYVVCYTDSQVQKTLPSIMLLFSWCVAQGSAICTPPWREYIDIFHWNRRPWNFMCFYFLSSCSYIFCQGIKILDTSYWSNKSSIASSMPETSVLICRRSRWLRSLQMVLWQIAEWI